MKKLVLLFALLAFSASLIEKANGQCSVTITQPDQLQAVISGNATICSGGSTTISVALSGGTTPWKVTYNSFDYTGSSSPITFSVSPSTTTTYDENNVTVTDANGCTGSPAVSVTGSAVVTVNALPAITNVTAAANPICANTTTTLTANGVAGDGATVTWWTQAGGTGTNLGTGLTLANATLGTYYARVTGTCTPAIEASITVLGDPLPIASAGGSTNICEYASYTLLIGEATASYGTIAWTENGAGSITAGATSLTPTYTAAAGDAGNTVTLTMTVTNTNTCAPQIATANYTINVYNNFTAGAIATTGETICYNTDPAVIGSTTAASGGDGVIEYKWQSSPDGSTWSDIASSNAETLDPSNLTSTTHYQRLAKDGICNSFTASTGVWIVTVRPQFTPGAIATTGQTICTGENPGVIGSTTAASGGDGQIEYKWQSSPYGSSWTDISASNAATYDPSSLTTTTHYQRLAKDGTCNSFAASTGVWVVAVNQPSRRYVTVLGAGAKTGLDWSNAYDGTQLQSAISESCVNEVWVAKGTYKPTVQVGGSGPRYQTYQMKNGVAIYGGFAGTESLVTERNDFGSGGANETVLSGDLNGDDNYTTNPWTGFSENCYHVFYHPQGLNLNATAVLDGFIIKGGNADYGLNQHFLGAGMMNDASSPTIGNVTFVHNSATYGGAVYLINASPVVSNSKLTDNKSLDAGGAIYMQGTSAPVFTNVMIAGNTAYGNGGGIYWASSGYPVFINTTFTDNTALDRGGAIYLNGQSTGILYIRNSILWGNLANNSSYPGKQVFWYSGTISLHQSCYANGSGDMHLNVGFYNIDSYCITTDPQFVDSPSGDYRIKGVSPCADAGNDSYNDLLTDIRAVGFGRKILKTDFTQPGTIDMGAYEYNTNTDPMGCINPTNSGTIGIAQTICQGVTPAELTETAVPGGSPIGTLQYKWQASINDSSSGFADITDATGETYQPDVLTQTTWYKRLVKVDCESNWLESNVVEITVNPLLQYRTVQSGNWTTLANWQHYNGFTWVEATSYPGEISNDCDDPLVSIQAGHQMEIQAGTNITIPKLEIKTNGRLTVKSGGKIIIEDKLNLDMQSGAAIVVE